MKNWLFLLCAILTVSCQEEKAHDTLVLENLAFFDLYDSSCESWIEQKFPCSKDSCFSSAAVEIVGIDTSDSHRYQIYAWSWSEHFMTQNKKAFSGSKKLLITRFTMNPSSRANKILQVYIPNEEQPIDEQLTLEQFPEKIIDSYFTKQAESVERIRIQALNKKATEKYKLYLSDAYATQTDVFTEDTTSVTDTASTMSN